MEKRTLEIAAVQITAFQQKLLQEPDPAIANQSGLFRVPIGEGVGYSAADWTHAWRAGSIEFVDAYYLAHGKQPSKETVTHIEQYLYLNLLDPMILQNWTTAYDRLQAVGIIKQGNVPKEVPVEAQASKQLTPAEFAKEVAQAMEKIDTRTPAGRKQLAEIRQKYLILEAQPIVAKFIADLNAQGHYPTDFERDALLEWIQNHNLVLTNYQSWAAALQALFPKYLTEADRLSQEIDRDDSITSADLRKALGTLSPKVGYAVQSR